MKIDVNINYNYIDGDGVVHLNYYPFVYVADDEDNELLDVDDDEAMKIELDEEGNDSGYDSP